MSFLYEKYDGYREDDLIKEMPKYIPVSLNQKFELRPYQIRAFENFVTFFEVR